MRKPKFSVKWHADGRDNERFFDWLVDAADFAQLLSNTNASAIKVSKNV